MVDKKSGKRAKTLPAGSVEDKITLEQVAEKLDNLARSIEQLTSITLENRRFIESLKVAVVPLPPGSLDGRSSGYEKPGDRSKRDSTSREKSSYNPSPYQNPVVPMIPLSETEEDEGNAELRTEERIKQYEEKNPW